MIEELKKRGLVHSISDEKGLKSALESPLTFYCGFDPTGESLHVGSLLPIITMRRFIAAGHKAIALVGTTTGMIGDPSGKSEERNLLDSESIAKNAQAIGNQLKDLLGEEIKTRENHEWLGSINLVEFLRDVGKHFSVNQMCAKDSVKSRLESREQGISYTEFSYMLFQAYDFMELYQKEGCKLQIGGSDQWGNITEGCELIRRKLDGAKAFGLTIPLLTTASGQKFGKTEKGAVWLNKERTKPYEFYQFWVNLRDEDVSELYKFFSEKDLIEINEILKSHEANPEKRLAQISLAKEMTELVHGKEEADRAILASQVFFGGSLEGMSASALGEIFSDVPSGSISKSELGQGLELSNLLVKAGITKSKGEAKRLVSGGGVYLNNLRAESPGQEIGLASFIDGEVLVVRSGKKKYSLVRLAD